MKKSTVLQIIIVFLIIGFSYYKTSKKITLLEELKIENFKTIGTITNQYSIGYSSSYYVSYEYTLNNKIYKKEINYGQKFIGCDKSKQCIGKQFYVYYEKNNPNIAIIDFDKEITEKKSNKKN